MKKCLVSGQFTKSTALPKLNWESLRPLSLWSLSNDDEDGNENGKKAIGLISKPTTFHVHHAFLYISLPSLPDYNVKVPEFTFCRGREHKTTTFFSFPELWYSPLEFLSTPKTFANIWRSKRDGISTIKFEAVRIHFLSDVFVTVAVVVA